MRMHLNCIWFLAVVLAVKLQQFYNLSRTSLRANWDFHKFKSSKWPIHEQTGNMEEFYLEIFPGDYGLPSLDPECLHALAYCRFSGIPIKVRHQVNLFSAKVPALKTTKETIYGAENIIAYFEGKNFRPDGEQTVSNIDLWAFKTLVHKKLEPFLQFSWWSDNENYNQMLRPWYAQRLPFPTNFFIPNSLRKQAVAKLEAQFSSKVMESASKTEMIENLVTSDARYCLNLMHNKFMKKRYFFDDKPTSADALSFTYLALMYKVPVNKSAIRNHIGATDSLRDYVDRTLKMYFSGADSNSSSSKSPFDADKNAGDSFSKIKWSEVIFSGAFAAFLMLFYAVSKGILSISDDSEFVEEVEEEDEHVEH